jgi:CheY-like chemotaxis protein
MNGCPVDGLSFSAEGRKGTAGLRVLAVDPNRDAADMLALLLRLWGYDARVAYSGPEALEMARAYRPGAVLSEVRLPGMDGCDLARRLRRELGAVTLIAVTGCSQPADRVRTQEAGFDRHLVKPADPHQLRELLAFAAYRVACSKATSESAGA